MTPSDLDAALHEVPIFPLREVVLFPGALLPLHIFEPRYRAMVREALETHRMIAMALLPAPGDVDERGLPRICDVVGVGRIVKHEPLSDGRANIVLQGIARTRIDELPFVPPFRRGRATRLDDVTERVGDTDRAALFAAATQFAAEIAKRDPTFAFELPPGLEPGPLADLCAHHLLVDPNARQGVLEELHPAERVRRVVAELAEQHAALLHAEGSILN